MFLIKVNMPIRDAYRLLADCQKMHQFVTGLFGTDRNTSQVLYRTKTVQQTLSIYIYANRPVDPALCRYRVEQRDISKWLDTIQAGQYCGFDLIASPSKKEGTDGQKNSKRRSLRTQQERMDWLNRKASNLGFSIVQATEQDNVHICGNHDADNGGKMYHNAYHYQGVVQITNADLFRQALQNGIGPGKAYGFGMMMVQLL